MFSLTCEMFLPDNYNTIITSSSHPQQSLVNSPQRYITKAAEEAGVLSEIYETVPERFHGLMREHSQFGILVSFICLLLDTNILTIYVVLQQTP